MKKEEIIEMLEEAMDLDPETLKEDTVLADFDEWDSLAKLSLLAAAKKNFKVALTAADVKGFVVVADVINYFHAE